MMRVLCTTVEEILPVAVLCHAHCASTWRPLELRGDYNKEDVPQFHGILSTLRVKVEMNRTLKFVYNGHLSVCSNVSSTTARTQRFDLGSRNFVYIHYCVSNYINLEPQKLSVHVSVLYTNPQF